VSQAGPGGTTIPFDPTIVPRSVRITIHRHGTPAHPVYAALGALLAEHDLADDR
jgi:hypothetical protein